VSVAQSFASGSGQQLSIKHIYTVLDVMRDWQKAKQASIEELSLSALNLKPEADTADDSNSKPETKAPDNQESSTEKSDASSSSDTNSRSLSLTNGSAETKVYLQPQPLDVRLGACLSAGPAKSSPQAHFFGVSLSSCRVDILRRSSHRVSYGAGIETYVK
jgi:hypothetical protein